MFNQGLKGFEGYWNKFNEHFSAEFLILLIEYGR